MAVNSKKDALWVRWVHEVHMKGNKVECHKKRHGVVVCTRLVCPNSKWKIFNWSKLQFIVKGMRIAEFMWNKISQPRHQFIIWLAVQCRLLTKYILRRMNILVDNTSTIYLDHDLKPWDCDG